MRNPGLIVAAVAVLVVAFVLLQGGGDQGAGTSAGVSTTQETVAPAATTSAPEASTTPEPEATPAPKPEVPTVEFADGEPKGGVKKLEFDKGEQVRFKVRSDVDEEIHVHGFDETKDVAAGKSVTFAFKAEFDGAYEVEMEQSGTEIASLVVQP